MIPSPTLFPRRFSRFVLGALLAGALLTGCSQPSGDARLAAQVAPETTEVTVADTFPLECSLLGYGFDVLIDYEFDLRFTLFFDRKGDPKKGHIQVNGTELYTNTESGKTARSTNAGVDIEDFEAGTYTQLGVLRILTVPGEGQVLVDVGRIVFDESGDATFVAGPHEVVGTGDFTPICDAMS